MVAQTATDAEGGYSLNNLLPAPHTIRFLLTDAYVCTDPSDTGAPVENHVTAQTPEYGETPVLRLAPGQSLTNISGGIFRSATVSGQVLLSTGIASLPAEGGMEGVHVILLDEKGNAVSDTTEAYTDADGHFYLKGALPGTYMLEYRLPEHAAFTQPDTISPVIYSDPFTTGAADDLVQAPLYAIYTGCLGGRIYRDSSLNGAYDPEETALGGVPLQLENTDLGLVYETISHEDGTYLLDDLRPGAYALRVTLPEELCFAYDASSPIAARAVSGAEAALNIGIGDRLEQRNIAAAAPAQLNGSIYFDLENDGKRGENDPGAAGITLSLRSVNGAQSYSVQTDSSGRFALAALVPGNYTLRVTLDSDCIPADGNDAQLTDGFWTSSLVFADGESAAPEYGILRHARVAGHVWSLDGTLNGVTGRTVELFMEADNEPLGTAVTDENGAFSFDQLKPGQYKLRCDLPDERYDFARPVDAALRAGAKPDVPVGYYDYFQVSMGADMTACDIGIGAMGSLGDTAWLDLNGNGLQDAEEPNLPGVTIRLYQYGTLAAETVTDAYGHYLITDLYPGAYTVQVTPPVEVKPTLRRTDYPLAASVLTETEEATAEAEGITVPSAGRNLNCDFGFVPRQEGGFPASLQDTPATDWSFNGARK